MTAFATRRLGHIALMLLGVSALSFVLLELAPGDYFTELRLDPRLSTEAAARLRERYGLDRPFLARYGVYLTSLARGEMGHSFAYDQPVSRLLAPRAARTLLVTATALLASWLAGLAFGITAARRQNTAFDRFVLGATSALSAAPSLVVAVATLAVAAGTGWLPIGGMRSIDVSPDAWVMARDVAWHMVQPVFIVTLATAPFLVRQVRAAWLGASKEPFLQAARARGLGEGRLALHTLRAASPPLLALLGLTMGGLLSTSMVAEVVSGWPGLGPFVLEAILAHDVHVVIGGALLAALMLGLGQLAADLLLYAVDPRLRRAEP